MREATLSRSAGTVGHGGDSELQAFFMQSGSSFCNQVREQIAVGPQHIFEVDLKAAVSVLLALAENRGDERASRRGCREKFVKFSLHHGCHDRHDRHMVLRRRLQHKRIRAAPHESVAIDAIPGRYEDVDFIGVLGKRLNGVRVVRHVEERLGLRGGQRRTRQDKEE